MADKRKQKPWVAFEKQMKAKRQKGGGAKNETGNILDKQELVVQRLSSEVSGKAQKYTRVGPREFVQYDEQELTIAGIKAACEKHFSSSLTQGLSCDVLAGEQGPSCLAIKHIPDLKVIHIRFIKGSTSFEKPQDEEHSAPSQQYSTYSSAPPMPSEVEALGKHLRQEALPKDSTVARGLLRDI